MISQEDVENALAFISENSEAHAKAKARVKGLEHRFKVAEAEGFKEAKGNIEERKAAARTTEAYLKLVAEHDGAWYDFQVLDTDMEYAKLVFEAWRTDSANLRGG